MGEVRQLEEFILDADIIEDIFQNPDPKQPKKIERELVKHFQKHAKDPRKRP
jgi:type I restriction enzyme R subunit